MQPRTPVLALALLASCVKIEPFKGGSGPGSDAGVDTAPLIDAPPACDYAHTTTIAEWLEQGHQVVCGPHFAMRFSPDGAGYPSSFQIDGRELLGTADTCEDEDGFGIGLYPAGVIARRNPTQPNFAISTRSFNPLVRTSFLYEVQLGWRLDLTTTNCTESLQGKSTFAFFADGRIVRGDRLDATGTATAANCQQVACAAAAGASQWVEDSYFAFDWNEGTDTLVGAAPPMTVGTSTQLTAVRSFCLSRTAVPAQLGIALSDTNGRVRRVAASTAALTTDFATTSTLPNASQITRSTLAVFPNGCDLDRMALLQRDTTIMINNVPTAPGLDGIYGDIVGVDIPANTATTILADVADNHTVPGGWAVRVHFPQPISGVTAERGDHVPLNVQVADVSPTHDAYVLYFADDLSVATGSIVVTPL